MIVTHFFDTGKPGPKIVFLGAIHGNEVCGPLAMKKIIDDLESQRLKLLCGSILLVPVCNEQAHAKNMRFVDEDLNRVFRKTDAPQSYEQTIANELTPFVDQSDVLLDIHSMQADGPVNIFIDFPTPENKTFARALGAPYAIVGWPDLYEHKGKGLVSYDTTAYAHATGKIGILVECGQHKNPEAVKVAYTAINRTLAHFGLIADSDDMLCEDAGTGMKEIMMTDLFIKNAEGDRLVAEWKHLDTIAPGQIIAERATGEKISAEYECMMVLPKLKSLVGKEWFYLGKAGKN